MPRDEMVPVSPIWHLVHVGKEWTFARYISGMRFCMGK